MTNDIIMLIIGTFLGFGASIATIKYQEYDKRKRALNIFQIELYKIDKIVSAFAMADNQSVVTETNETIIFSGISTFEIPNFKMVIQIDVFLSLNKNLRQDVYDVSLDLEAAEDNRKVAISLLNLKESANLLNFHASIYIEHLKVAKIKIDKLKNEYIS
ncbi:hypothetical protein IRZ71_05225 [Flavobacterium sp. ANB]|uniref:hypothetical protein n=1 Tax=unclassified Flavobacterium TaxID=196869 RepID=UPI0012B6D55F|nr:MULTISPECIES: hypothetical protein [unclassified Flavobacterium]MBF4515730.1 hypothetical protein [Flavobacterium sp. ANB]MTD68733.1 hypothetical protein [Flavobacterium sp. LC2016-13]